MDKEIFMDVSKSLSSKHWMKHICIDTIQLYWLSKAQVYISMLLDRNAYLYYDRWLQVPTYTNLKCTNISYYKDMSTNL